MHLGKQELNNKNFPNDFRSQSEVLKSDDEFQSMVAEDLDDAAQICLCYSSLLQCEANGSHNLDG